VNDLKALAARHATRQFEIRRFGGDWTAELDDVATEEPLEIRLGYSQDDGTRTEASISITMRTPGSDDELAVGFLFGEGIITRAADVELVRPCGPPAANGLINVIRVELAADVRPDVDRLERHFYTTSSCGVCGKASLEAVAVHGRFAISESTFTIGSSIIGTLPEQLLARQSLFGETGGIHASGLFNSAGNVVDVREDVGRHNALDKLIGAQLRAGRVPLLDRGILVSGRASFELLQKAMVAGCPLVAAVGAPSSLAVELAAEFDLTLVGFLRPDRFNVYTNPHRILT
jgi:FdhD protein